MHRKRNARIVATLGPSNSDLTTVRALFDAGADVFRLAPVQASASQDPWAMSQMAVGIGYGIMNGKKPANPMVLLPSTLVTRDNVNSYKGWSSLR